MQSTATHIDPTADEISRLIRLSSDPSVSPGMQQFFGLKVDHLDYLLFYRMGDFYELFFDDAIIASELLGIALTKRGKVEGKDIPMCGVPFHAADGYLEQLIAKGQKVAICEQMESPIEAKKRGYKSVVKREVVRIITPGTITEDSLLMPNQSNYLAAYVESGGKNREQASIAWIDISTGEFGIIETAQGTLTNDLARIDPKELLISDALYQGELAEKLIDYKEIVTFIPTSALDAKRAEKRLKEYFQMSALDAWGHISATDMIAAASLLDYIQLTQKAAPPRLNAPQKHSANHAMVMDGATRRNLELTTTLAGERRGSLLHIIDKTLTAAGSRMLGSRLCNPLTDATLINQRLAAVESFVSARPLRSSLREALKQCPDIERGFSRLLMGRGGARDMLAIARGLTAAQTITHEMQSFQQNHAEHATPDILTDLFTKLGQHDALINELGRALHDSPPLLTRDGGFIAKGYNAELDEFTRLRDDSKQVIAAMQTSLAAAHEIPPLKIKHNNVLGYFIELTAMHEAKVPETFIHRQSMKNALRYTTIELSEIEQKISEAAGKALRLELQVFEQLLSRLSDNADSILLTASSIAEIDVYTSLAELAEGKRYTRPTIDNSTDFTISGGRHPVVEAVMKKQVSDPFIANDCQLGDDHRLWLLTGPNMAGKSTFLRQNALITILAQMGSFVPAQSANIGVVDRLFSRVGAADDLARGRSTFMVEMVETATILAQSTERSLVILDEIGRGTATFDGLSIAWAVVEHLHNHIQCRGLFATHYHELTQLTETLAQLGCYSMQVREWKGDVIFLHQVKQGTANRSYGIHVAKLAGLPQPVIHRAGIILKTLEAEKNSPTHSLSTNALPLFSCVNDAEEPADVQDDFAVETTPSELVEQLTNLQPDSLSPREALQALYDLKELLD